MARETLKSRFGFILLSAGCAIGIGNVWKFPYLVGQNGGGAFVLLYLFFLIVLGIPVMTMEFSLGRAARRSPVRMYQRLTPEKWGWHWHGYACWFGCIVLMMFYTTVAGWMLLYFYQTACGAFAGLPPKEIGAAFGAMLADPLLQVVPMVIVVFICFLFCSHGLQSGLERVTKCMMVLLLVIMVVLAVNSLFLEGAEEGISFYLRPDIMKMEEIGFANVIVAAMNQAFFTLSLGIGAMAIFGSYIPKDHALLGESVNVAILDTLVAITSGLIIIPACFAYGVEPDSGPSLIFITLPNIFNHMAGGIFWGSLFFLFMTFAAFSTVLAVFENIMACTMDLTGWSRKKAGFVNCVAILVLSLPCALGFNLLAGVHPMGGESSFLDLEDFIVSNILLPGGSLIFVLYSMHRFGWGWKKFYAEANTGNGMKLPHWARGYFAYVRPLIVGAVFVLGLM